MPRRLRSEEESASLPPPSKRRAIVQANNASENVTYFLRDTVKGIPNHLRAKNVSRCSIEFLDIGPYDIFLDAEDPVRINHSVLRLTFQHEIENATPYAPEKTKGLILDLTPNGEQAEVTAGGDLMIMTFTYSGQHKKALGAINLSVNCGKKVRDFLRAIQNFGLIPCGFTYSYTNLLESLTGCRDFVSQLVYHLSRANVIKLPADANSLIYSKFNRRYCLKGEELYNPVSYAVFSEVYSHVAIDGINYSGNRHVYKLDEPSIKSSSHSKCGNGEHEVQIFPYIQESPSWRKHTSEEEGVLDEDNRSGKETNALIYHKLDIP